jgi:hypothetical protein
MNERDREFADAARVIDESLIMRAVGRITGVFVGRAFQARRLPALKGPAYIVLLATGCLTHALLLQFMPDRLAPVKPLAYGMVLAFAALATAAGLMTMRSSATAIADSSAGTANTRNS